ncbi:uncharacterized protein J3R85_013562 [Psidium guajava]|nr:uncharacterized protein J3R85_013562 [Psidium guajava]
MARWTKDGGRNQFVQETADGVMAPEVGTLAYMLQFLLLLSSLLPSVIGFAVD